MVARVLNTTVISSASPILTCGANTTSAFDADLYTQNATVVYSISYEQFS